MTFEQLVDRLMSLHDCGQQRAVDVANERIARMAEESRAVRATVNLGSTVAGQTGYAVTDEIVQVFRVKAAYTAGTTLYQGTESRDALEDLQLGLATVSGCGQGHWYVFDPDSDDSAATSDLFLWPAPEESGVAITGRCAVIPDALSYTSGTALPFPRSLHDDLLAGCRATLLSEESRQDEAVGYESQFAAGVRKLEARERARGKGSDRHRLRMARYDF